MHCFFASIYGKWFPWEFTDGHTPQAGAGGGVGGELSRFAHLVCAILHGIGLWDIQS